VPTRGRLEFILRDAAVRNVGLPIQRQDLRFRQTFEEVAKTVHDHLVRDDQHALSAVFAGHRVEHAAQPQDDVAPALAAGRTKIELADVAALLAQRRIGAGDARHGHPVQDAELLFAEPLIRDHARRRRVHDARDDARGFQRPQIRRREHHRRAFGGGLRCKPVGQRTRLLLAQRRERNVHVPRREVDEMVAGRFCRVTGDVACALAVPHQPHRVRPFLHCRGSAHSSRSFVHCRGLKMRDAPTAVQAVNGRSRCRSTAEAGCRQSRHRRVAGNQSIRSGKQQRAVQFRHPAQRESGRQLCDSRHVRRWREQAEREHDAEPEDAECVYS